MFKWATLFTRKEVERDIVSPNGQLRCHFTLKSGNIWYSVYRTDKRIIAPSRLSIDICGENPLGHNLKLVRSLSRTHQETIEMPWGEDRYIPNNYTESIFYFSENTPDKRIFTLRFKVFDDAVAFRYEIPPQPKFRQISIKDENTEFNIDQNSIVWKIPAYQPDRYEYNYEKAVIHELDRPVHTPLTIKTPNGYYLAIHEAALYNYGSMTIKKTEKGILQTDITPLSDGTRAHVILPFQTPWRLIMVAGSAIELTTNRTMYALNDAPSGDFSWVNTLKFIGIWWAMYVGEWTWAPGERHGATTAHAKEYIDAAVRLGISGLLIEGWNEGWEGDWLENGINNKFSVATSDFNLEEVASYARRNKIEIVGHHETVGFIDNYERQLEDAYNYYAANGVHYIKTGYAGSMMLIHGRREFHHSRYLPYTRMLSGGMDYTSGILDLANSVKRMSTTLARQLAYFVTIYSGMQMAADRPFIYEERFPEEFEFIRSVPTNFERTLPLAGEIGEYYVVARKDRETDDWYIGGVTNESGRRVHLTLDFLDSGAYEATIYADAENAHYRDEQFAIIKQRKHVGRQDSLDLYMAPGGGFAIRLKRSQSA